MTNENMTTTSSTKSNKHLHGTLSKAIGQKNFCTREKILDEAYDEYVTLIDELMANGNVLSPNDIFKGLAFAQREAIIRYNIGQDKDHTFQKPSDTEVKAYIGQLMIHFDHIAMISMSDCGIPSRDNALLAIYCDHGELEGTWSTEDSAIRIRIKEYSKLVTKKLADEIIEYLKTEAKILRLTRDGNLTAVANGVYDKKSHTLLPFSPDYIFLRKLDTAYNPNAQNVHIQMPDGRTWDCEWQIDSYSDDPEIRNLIRQMYVACARPNNPWNKAIMPYSTKGNNGKGTLAESLRQLYGSTTTSLSLVDMSKEFGLTPIINGANIIISDENPVGTYIDRCDAFKAMVTHDAFTVPVKHKNNISDVVFHGIIIQCLNEYPLISDRTRSWLRRVIILPFDADFEGAECKEIKTDYIKRQDVKEYYLRCALESDCEEFTIPKACEEALREYQAYNDATLEFWQTVESELVWRTQPKSWLYELYKAWFAENNPCGRPLSSKKFWKDLTSIVETKTEYKDKWTVRNDQPQVTDKDMAGHEQLIIEYQVKKYMNPTHMGSPNAESVTNFVRPTKVNCALIKNGD